MLQKCKNCNGRGYVRVNIEGLYLDAGCLDCNKTGYVEVPEVESDMQVSVSEGKKITRQVCKSCNGRGHALVNLCGALMDVDCFTCNKTGYVEVEI